MQQKVICIINTPDMPVPFTHYLTTNKFARGFEVNGYEKCEIKNWEELDNIPDTVSTVFMVSNHGVEDNWDGSKLEPLARFKKAVKLLWHFHSFLIHAKNNGIASPIPFDRWILTGEHMHSPPGLASHQRSYAFQSTLENYEPLTFSTYLKPEVVGHIKRGPILWDAQFVGSPYKTEWSRHIENSFIKTIPLSVSEEERAASFLQAHCALGFHSPENVLNNVVVERVPEALGFGAVCLTDSPAAVSYTQGAAVLVSSLEEVKHNIQLYKSDSKLAEEKRQQGYEWVRNNGTYDHVAKRFLKKFETLGYD